MRAIMISIICLTYKRHHLLEEAIYSFLQQDYEGEKEMVIINDAPNIKYVYNHPKIKIHNLKNRFPSIGEKLEWGMKQCAGDHIYRLDDDDLLTPWALTLVNSYITENPNYDIYRCSNHYYFSENKFISLGGSINNGNCYSKKFINSIKFPTSSIVEDAELTFHRGGSIFTGNVKKYSMIYRWGMSTYHISGWGKRDSDFILSAVDDFLYNQGNNFENIVTLNPNFMKDYYRELPK